MAKLLVLAENMELLKRWRNILHLSTSMSIQSLTIDAFKMVSYKEEDVEMVFISTNGFMNKEVEPLLRFFKSLGIPIICTDREVSNQTPNKEIMNKGIRATINIHLSILTIREVLKIVTNGGLYIDRE